MIHRRDDVASRARRLWLLYVPQWAPISVVDDPDAPGNRCLELRDEDPYDQAVAERAFPEASSVTVRFRARMDEIPQGRVLEFEVADRSGGRPMRLRFDRRWLYVDRGLVTVDPVPLVPDRWYQIAVRLDAESQTYDLAVDGAWVRREIPFAEEVRTLERMEFRTGPYRGDVRAAIVDSEPRPSGLYTEDLPGSEERLPASVFLIDDVRTE